MEKNLKNLKIEHDRFFSHEQPDPAIISDAIRCSWERCRKMGLDPEQDGSGLMMPEEKYREICERHRDLIEISQPQIEAIYNLVKDSGFIVNLVSPEGTILAHCGDPEVIRAGETMNYRPGANWNEDQVGTNGISLALNLVAPVQVVGPEHYCCSHHSWTCSAAPILSSEGKLLGVLNMSGSAYRKHVHTLGMVAAAARAIENQYKLLTKSSELEIANRKLSAIIENTSDGLLVCNAKGTISYINDKLAETLRLDPEKTIGESVYAIGLDLNLMEVLSSVKGYHDRELRITRGSRKAHYYITANLIRNSRDHIEDVIFIFREVKSARRLMNRMLGTRANYTFDQFLTISPGVQGTIRMGKAASESNSNVLLLGESGTGKEIFAQSIHNEGPRRKEPFIALNCSAIPRDLIESELFGYEAGAFTGGKKEGNPGKFELADGGTLLLDEIGDMSFELQSKLLRVIQDREITRIGGKHSIPVDVRIIASTNKNLWESVKKNEFREDLYYRLNVLTIYLPPIRERKEDVPLLVSHFLEKHNHQLGKSVNRVTDEVMECLTAYSWPGNVRELENIIERAMNLVAGDEISMEFIPPRLRQKREAEPAAGIKPMTEMERDLIEKALDECRWNVTQTARRLGIGRNTLYRKINDYGISLRR
jgi:sigma-54 dependent transcriptional regulator, acetoin dehydrogenase operon transcriptional activator AcoR